jgi:hypothetical protein
MGLRRLDEQGEVLRVPRSTATASPQFLPGRDPLGEFQFLMRDGFARFGDELAALTGEQLCHERIRCSNLAISVSKGLLPVGVAVLSLERLAAPGDGGDPLLDRGEGLRLDRPLPEASNGGFPPGGNKLEKNSSL